MVPTLDANKEGDDNEAADDSSGDDDAGVEKEKTDEDDDSDDGSVSKDSNDDESSGPQDEDGDDDCIDCLKPIFPHQKRDKKRRAHAECSLAVRSALHALKDKPELLKKFKASRENDPRAYARGILKMCRKNREQEKGTSSNKKRRTNAQKAGLIKCLTEVCRVKTMTRDEGSTLSSKGEYIIEMRRRKGWKNQSRRKSGRSSKVQARTARWRTVSTSLL